MSTEDEGWTDFEDGQDESEDENLDAEGENEFDDSVEDDDAGEADEGHVEGDDGAVEPVGDEDEDDSIDYKAEYERKAAMVESLKKDTHENRKRRQEAENELKELRAEKEKASGKALDLEIDAAKANWKRITTGDEDGDEIEAQEKLFRLIARRENAVQVQSKSKQDAAKESKSDDEQDSKKPAEEATKWIRKNSWFRRNGKLTAKAVEISRELEYEGYDVNDPDLYQELDKRLKPHRQRMNKGQRPSVSGVSRGGGREKPSGKTLSREDKATMSTFGFDPNNPKDKAMWLRRNEPLR